MIHSSGRKKISVYGAIIVFMIVSTAGVLAKHKDDVVVLKNGDRVTGEIKGLQRGELRIKADYMAEALRLDWARVDRIESKSRYMIWLVDGTLFTDVMRVLPSTSNDINNFVIGSGQIASVKQMDVLRITPVESRFLKQLEGSIDFGLSYTSGNDQYSTELVATTTYRTGSHSFTTSLDSAFTGQPQGDSTRRNQFTFDYRKQLNPRWYAGGLFDLLNSDQQSLSLRTTENFDSKPPVRADKNELGISTSLGWKF